MPILELSGQLAGPSEPKLAWASVQSLCPSAASGLIVNPAGRVTTDDFISEGEADKPSKMGDLSSRLRPDGASVSLVVALAWRTGLKVSRSHSVIGRIARLGLGKVFGVLIGLNFEAR